MLADRVGRFEQQRRNVAVHQVGKCGETDRAAADDDHVVTAGDLTFDLFRGVFDAREISHRGAAEFHHETSNACRRTLLAVNRTKNRKAAARRAAQRSGARSLQEGRASRNRVETTRGHRQVGRTGVPSSLATGTKAKRMASFHDHSSISVSRPSAASKAIAILVPDLVA